MINNKEKIDFLYKEWTRFLEASNNYEANSNYSASRQAREDAKNIKEELDKLRND